MFWQRKPIEQADFDSPIKYRLQLLEYYAFVTATVWGVVSVTYLLGFRYYLLGAFTAVGCLTSFATLKLAEQGVSSRSFLANLFLFGNVLVLCGCTIFSNQTFSQTAMYYPLVVFLAAQLVGVRVALVWSAALLGISAVEFSYHFQTEDSTRVFADRMLHIFGTIITAFWLSFESEKYFNLRTRHLEKTTESLQEKTRLLELAEETAGVGHWRWDPNTDQVTLSAEAQIICGVDQHSQTIPLADFVKVWNKNHANELTKHFTKGINLSEGFKQELSSGAGELTKHVSCRGIFERDTQRRTVAIFGTLRDDTQLRSTTDRLTVKAEELNQLASFDPLTGLANRFQFQQQLSEQVKQAVREDNQMALLVLDMNGFKEINDSLGHAIGDEVLKVAAERLESIVCKGDLVSRLGGDEFTVIVRNAKSAQDVEAVAQRIVKSIAAPMEIDGLELYAGVSIGASLAPTDTANAEELFTFADTAMYVAKAAKKGLAAYTTDMTQELQNRRSVENQLVGAIKRNEFHVLFQPQSDIESGKISGFETLLRWTNNGKNIPPLEFIPLLEGNGKIVEVGQWVLERSCEQVAELLKLGFPTRIAVNISPVQFREANFTNRVKETIQKYNIPPKLIELEITEGLLIKDFTDTSEKLFMLKEFGCRISVDDFGTGYSSLAYLKHLPIDLLKIDREFIKDIPSADDGMIAASVIVLGQSLDMEVLAEGVETQAQLDFLKAHTCHAYQGNLLGKPMSSEDCVDVIKRESIQRSSLV